MGNTTSAATSSLHRLPDATAFAVATAWRARLYGLVRLETDPIRGRFEIVRSYAWIVFHEKMDASQAAVAREATIAWFWLSCCAGYGGTENPTFWKHVFSELVRPNKNGLSYAVPPDCSVTDAVRFFELDDGECVFPRVKLNSCDPAVRQAFFGTAEPPPRWAFSRSKHLLAILKQLEPFLVPSRLPRRVDVAISQLLSPNPANDRWIPSSEPRGAPNIADDELESFAPSSRVSSVHPVPEFEVRSIRTHVVGLPSLNDQTRVFTDERVDVAAIGSGVYEMRPLNEGSTQAETARRLRPLFRISPSHNHLGQVHAVDLRRRDTPSPLLVALLSLLPHSRTVRTLRIVDRQLAGFRSAMQMFHQLEPVDWAWLGYALFHPDAETSAWRSLSFTLSDFDARAETNLKLMAIGNNFESILKGSQTPTSTMYHSARLRDHARVRISEYVNFDHADDFRWVCLCVDSVENLDATVRVVLPGFGFAWVRSADIVEIVSCPPATSRLLALGIDLLWNHATTRCFVSLTGHSLTHLDLGSRNRLEAAKLGEILRMCPKLESLTVEHNGELWSDAFSTEPGLPLLRQLHLIVGKWQPAILPGRQALQSSLQHLTALRISANVNQVSTAELSSLLSSPSRFRYLHIDGENYAPALGEIRPYLQGRAETQSILSKLPGRSGTANSSSVIVGQRVAFASVVHAKRSADSPVGRLDEDLVSQIIAFMPSRGPTEVWIGPWA